MYPATLDRTHLVAELSTGEIIRTEGAIDRPTYDRAKKIKNVWLDPGGAATNEARQAILSADTIIIGPGSLYCSIVATLLPTGVKEAIGESKGKLILVVAHGYETDGETGPETISGYVEAVERFLPRPADTIVTNDVILNDAQRQSYREKKWAPFVRDIEKMGEREIVSAPYETREGGLSSPLLGELLQKII